MITPEDALDEYIFGNIWNHHNPYEDEYDITFVGNNFLLRDRETGDITHLLVSFGPGTLTEDEVKKVIEEQEWDGDYYD